MNEKDMGACLTAMKMALPQWAPSDVNQMLCSIWLDALQDFSDEQIVEAMKHVMHTMEKWPSISEIKKICMGINSSYQESGQDISSAIERAISKHGEILGSIGSEKKLESIKETVGDVGMEVVRLSGGWNSVVKSADSYDDLPSLRKKWRDLASSVMRKTAEEGQYTLPSLHAAQNRSSALSAAIAETGLTD